MSDAARHYTSFLNGLRGLIDDAEIGGYDPDGIKALNEALAAFDYDFGILHHHRPMPEKPE